MPAVRKAMNAQAMWSMAGGPDAALSVWVTQSQEAVIEHPLLSCQSAH